MLDTTKYGTVTYKVKLVVLLLLSLQILQTALSTNEGIPATSTSSHTTADAMNNKVYFVFLGASTG